MYRYRYVDNVDIQIIDEVKMFDRYNGWMDNQMGGWIQIHRWQIDEQILDKCQMDKDT